MPGRLRSFSPGCAWQLLRHFSHSPLAQGRLGGSYSNAVVIAAAVRTPSVSFQAEEQQLAGVVLDELVKRSSVPREEYKQVIVCSSPTTPAPECRERLTRVAKDLGLQCDTLALQDDVCSLGGLQMALDSLQRVGDQCIITGDLRCQVMQPTHGVLANELMAVQQPRSRTRNQAGAASSTGLTTLGAAALSWTTMQTAQRLQLQPLALLREFAVEQDHEQAMYRLKDRQPVTPSEIHTWNMVTGTQKAIPEGVLGDLHANRLCTHDFRQITASHLLTHLVHSLPAGALGCTFMGMPDGRSMVLVLEKLVPSIDQVQGLPLITLYTREPCPLCDDLVHRLEERFAGQYRLEKVHIDRKENVRFLRLFRHDIPVLFLNGQFLCMHRLNEEALMERLEALNRSR
ncbi:uncharacterized protein LOC128253110 [Drosophila gunungcola]|uniref:Glutaredoxin domain-containing protein n=1 Tax=Drosophila gunungcola TaxID=103775 RepID=A0A9Q0BNM7_9MUSC|nr:uncharacterized protein LOC128253110 [Drosophila gunungcola]XP_052837222.1 uncharacterized protein LOC128253110 [Drosophila gunungcola]KAI8038225.1 hypothetical protein M5D96_008914 [Drosophila gunungcola]